MNSVKPISNFTDYSGRRYSNGMIMEATLQKSTFKDNFSLQQRYAKSYTVVLDVTTSQQCRQQYCMCLNMIKRLAASWGSKKIMVLNFFLLNRGKSCATHHNYLDNEIANQNTKQKKQSTQAFREERT